MTVDETGLDETVVDETGVDELGINWSKVSKPVFLWGFPNDRKNIPSLFY